MMILITGTGPSLVKKKHPQLPADSGMTEAAPGDPSADRRDYLASVASAVRLERSGQRPRESGVQS